MNTLTTDETSSRETGMPQVREHAGPIRASLAVRDVRSAERHSSQDSSVNPLWMISVGLGAFFVVLCLATVAG